MSRVTHPLSYYLHLHFPLLCSSAEQKLEVGHSLQFPGVASNANLPPLRDPTSWKGDFVPQNSLLLLLLPFLCNCSCISSEHRGDYMKV